MKAFLPWIPYILIAIVWVWCKCSSVIIYDLKLKDRTYLQNSGQVAAPAIGKKRLLMFRGNPLVLLDSKGTLHRYADHWTPVTGQYIMEFTGLGKEEFFALPLENPKTNRFVSTASSR